MRHIIATIAAIAVCWGALQTEAYGASTPTTDITIDAGSYANNTIVLGYYFNGKMLVKDSLMTNNEGIARLQKNEKLDEGIYVVYFPDKTYFDIIVGGDQTFTLHCDTTAQDIVRRAKAEGAPMLTDFLDYQNYLADKHKAMQDVTERYKALAADDETGKTQLRAAYGVLEEEVKTRNEELIGRYKSTDDNFLAAFLTGLKEVETPLMENLPDSLRQVKRYYHYRNHYLDNIDLTDARMLRTPYVAGKIDKYLTEVVTQHPDTVAQLAIDLIERSKGNRETFQFYVSHIYNLFNNSKIMGMDAALVAIADKYYLSGVADWAEEKFISELRETIDELRYTLINHTAQDIRMESVTGEWYRLSEVRAPYTILVFWEPSCGHCKKEIPLLKEKVWDKYQKDGIKIFAVYCQVERKEWEDFIAEHQLEEWMNVYDPYGRSGFRKYYHIKSTPQIFILDKDKKIIAKKIGVEQIGDFLDFMMGKNTGEKK